MAKQLNVDSYQTSPLVAVFQVFITAPLKEQSDLGLHCLPRSACLNTKDHYGYTVSFKQEFPL